MPKLKKRPDGRYVKTLTDPRTGKRVYFFGTTEREVNRKIMEYSSKVELGRPFNEVAEEWWIYHEPKLAEQSKRRYESPKDQAVAHFGKLSVKKITTRLVQNYLNDLAKKQYAQKTVAQHRLVLSRIFAHATIQGDVEYNCVTATEVPKNLPKSVRETATTEEEKTIKASAHVWLFPYMALMTGMRKGELLALQWKDVDLDKNRIHVTKSVYHSGDKPMIKEPKTKAGIRSIPLLKPLKDVLLALPKHKPQDYIISDTGEAPLTNRRYCTLIKHFQKETGVTCTAHQLRHSFATIAFECGLDPKTVQEILGHKQLATTMDIYTAFRDKAISDAEEKLNSILS